MRLQFLLIIFNIWSVLFSANESWAVKLPPSFCRGAFQSRNQFTALAGSQLLRGRHGQHLIGILVDVQDMDYNVLGLTELRGGHENLIHQAAGMLESTENVIIQEVLWGGEIELADGQNGIHQFPSASGAQTGNRDSQKSELLAIARINEISGFVSGMMKQRAEALAKTQAEGISSETYVSIDFGRKPQKRIYIDNGSGQVIDITAITIDFNNQSKLTPLLAAIEYSNSAQGARNILRQAAPQITQGTQAITYDESNEAQAHFFAPLNRWTAGNFRHRIYSTIKMFIHGNAPNLWEVTTVQELKLGLEILPEMQAYDSDYPTDVNKRLNAEVDILRSLLKDKTELGERKRIGQEWLNANTKFYEDLLIIMQYIDRPTVIEFIKLPKPK
jgi:hypothetical protein